MAKSVITIPQRGTVQFDRNAPVIAPDAPTLLSADPGNGQNDLTWSSSAGAISYIIYFATSPGVTTGSTSISLGNVTSFSHSGLVNGTTYYYKVQAIGSGGGESPLSNELSSTPTAATFLNASSLELNGANQHGIIPFSQSGPIQYNRGQARSYSFWLNIDSANNRTIWDNRAGTSSASGAGTYISFNSNKLYASIGADSNTITKTAIQTFSLGSWCHVVVTYAGNSNVSGLNIYLDGAALATTQSGTILTGGTTYTASDNVIVGARGTVSGSDGYIDGKIDEVSVFDVELNSAEVNELYNSGNPADLLNHSRTANLVGWWRFGDAGDTSGIVFDQTSNNMDINLINSPSYSVDVP